MNPTDDIATTLRAACLFAGLDKPQMDRVIQQMRVVKLAEGERLFDFGQHAERFFMVKSGQIKLFRVSVDGAEKVIDILQPGQTFAEAVMFMEKQNYPVSSEALLESEVFSFDNRGFMQLLRESTDTCFRLMADMSQRLHMRLNEIDHLTLQNATFRLVSYLDRQVPADAGNSAEIQLSAPKSVIASRLSIQPETFSRILNNLTRAGIIKVKGKAVKILDVERLQDYGQ